MRSKFYQGLLDAPASTRSNRGEALCVSVGKHVATKSKVTTRKAAKSKLAVTKSMKAMKSQSVRPVQVTKSMSVTKVAGSSNLMQVGKSGNQDEDGIVW